MSKLYIEEFVTKITVPEGLTKTAQMLHSIIFELDRDESWKLMVRDIHV